MARTRFAAAALAFAASAACTTRADDPRTLDESTGEVQLAPEADTAVSSGLAQRAALRLVVAPGKNEARYRVRERLMNRELDNDAVGVTSQVAGGVALDEDGTVIPALSKFTVDVTNLTSDQARRDGYVRNRVLETAQFPQVTFAATSVRGLPKGAAAAKGNASYTFQVLGDLTVHGVTRPATWQATAKRDGATVTGSASTAFTFADFGLNQPRVPVVLSLSDTIRLEYDFTLAPAK